MSTTLFDLHGRIAIVTGASRGIGAATAQLLAEQGAHVVLASRKLGDLEKVRDEIIAAGGKASAIAAHGGVSEDLQRLLAETVRQHGRLDIPVNNAAPTPPSGHVAETPKGRVDQTVQVNLRGSYDLPALDAQHKTPNG